RFAEDEGQAGIAAAHRMTHAVLLGRIEEQHLVYFGDGLILSNAAHVDAAIGKHQLRGRHGLFGTLFTPVALATHVPDANGRGTQERLCREIAHPADPYKITDSLTNQRPCSARSNRVPMRYSGTVNAGITCYPTYSGSPARRDDLRSSGG